MQNTKLIKKISTSLVSTGEIIDSLQSNSSTSAPSIRSVNDKFNEIIDGTTQVGKAKMVGDILPENIITKQNSGLLNYPASSTNLLQISLDGSKNGLIERIYTSDASQLQNSPIAGYTGTFIAEKVQKTQITGHGMVEIRMVYPCTGCVFRNVYNNGWKGWKLVEGEIIIWTGSASEGSVLNTGYYSSSLFGSVSLLVSQGIELTRLSTGVVYAGNIFKGGDDQDWTLFGAQFTYSKSSLTINKLKQKSLLNDAVSKPSITAVIGRP